MADDLAALAMNLQVRLEGSGLTPTDQVRVLAKLISGIGWRLAQPGLSRGRRELEEALALRGDLAAALILQGTVLEEWVAADEPERRVERLRESP